MVVIIGAGISGNTAARLLAEQGHHVTIIDKRSHIGGNCYDHWDDNGICVHDYGTHIFHTDNRQVWDFISRFTKWYPFQHKVRGLIDGQLVPIPFNLNSIHQVFPAKLAQRLEDKLLETFGYNIKVPILKLRETDDEDLRFLADYIYRNIFSFYTQKQWDLNPEDLDPAVTGRVPVYISKDNRYFQNRYQGIPLEGYTAIFEKMLDHPNITVRLKTKFEDIRHLINKTDGTGNLASDALKADAILYSGPIDEYYSYEFGELPYRSERFDFLTFDREYFQSEAVINYPNNYTFTRIGEYKHFLGTKSDRTVVSYEYPEPFIRGKNERYYPIVNDTNQALYSQYKAKAEAELEAAKANPENKIPVYFFGRLGDYKYYDMDKAIERAMALVEEVA
ncbi:MAG: UDP-galactopyranose mutase [Oxalobacter sp.]|nr:UDP-galactopyranose mutase [Oxalobacter sp.]